MDALLASYPPGDAAHYPPAAGKIVYGKTESAPDKGKHPIIDYLSCLPFMNPLELENSLRSCKDADSFIAASAHMPSSYGGTELPFSIYSEIEPVFGLTIPCRELLTTLRQVLVDHPRSKKVVEVGAGSGYLSAFFQQAGYEVTATDIKPEYRCTRFVPVEKKSALDAMEAYPDHSVLLSWPMPGPIDSRWPSLDPEGYFSPNNIIRVIKELKPGNYIFYIHGNIPAISGEPYFLNAMKRCCTEIVSELNLPALPDGERSVLHVFRKTPYLLTCSSG